MMATDAADDDKKPGVHEAATSGDAAASASTPSAETAARTATEDTATEERATGTAATGSNLSPATDESASSKPKTVWTASDARGPLERAELDGPAAPHGDLAAQDETAAKAASIGSSASQGSTLKDGSASDTEHPAATAPRKSSVVPIAAGLIIGAIIGAGSAGLVYSMAGGSSPTPDPQVAALALRVAALEQKPDPSAAVSGLKTQVSDLQAKVAAAPKQPEASAAPAPVDLGPLQRKVDDLQNGLAALRTQTTDGKDLQAKVAALETEVSSLKASLTGASSDISTMKTSFSGLTDSQKSLAEKAMMPALAVVADSLIQQIDLGHPYQEQVNTLVALGADPAQIAILRQNAEKGVPSAKTLAAKFEPLAEPISATAHKAPPNAGFLDRLKSGMFSMVSIRNADDTSGPDLPSRVARIKADLAHDDVADALATWDALPADARNRSDVKEKGETWSALARASADAMAAARTLQQGAIAALGTKKS